MATHSPWLNEHGAYIDYSDTAQAPSKDFYHVFATPDEIIFRYWKIVPPGRADSHAPPVEMKNSYEDFLHDERCHSEIQRLAGQSTMTYLRQFAEGHVDYLSRIPDSVIEKVLLKLELTDLVRFGATCHKFRKLSNSDEVWEKIFRREVETPVTPDLETLAIREGWKRLFFTNKLQLQMQLRRQKRTDHDDQEPME